MEPRSVIFVHADIAMLLRCRAPMTFAPDVWPLNLCACSQNSGFLTALSLMVACRSALEDSATHAASGSYIQGVILRAPIVGLAPVLALRAPQMVGTCGTIDLVASSDGQCRYTPGNSRPNI